MAAGTGVVHLETSSEFTADAHEVTITEVADAELIKDAATVTSYDLTFDEGGGSHQLELRLAAPPGAVAQPSGVVLRLIPLAHQHTISVPGAAGDRFDVELGADFDVTELRLHGLTFPDNGNYQRFSEGGVTVKTPAPDDESSPTYEDVKAVLAAGPSGGAIGPPALGFSGFGAPGALFGPQLPSGSVTGTAASIGLRPPGALRAGVVQLTFCRFDGNDAVSLQPVQFDVDRVDATRRAWPEGLRVDLAGATVFSQPPALSVATDVNLAPVLGGTLDDALAARESDDPVTLPVTVSCDGPARLRVQVRSPQVKTPRRHFDRAPESLRVAGSAAPFTVPAPGPVATGVRSRLTGRFGPIRRTAASPDGMPPRGGDIVHGTLVDAVHHAARLVPRAALVGRPLVRVGLLGASSAGEVVVELRHDAGGPGQSIGAPGVLAVDAAGWPRWIAVPVGPLPANEAPDAGIWVAVRTNRGRFLWVDRADSAEARHSADGGSSWNAAPSPPALQLHIDDPGGTAPLVLRVGAATAALGAFPDETFDTDRTWPATLVHDLSGPDPVEVLVDCDRDVDVEFADLALVDRAPLTVHGVGS